MISRINFTNCEKTNITYTGADEKIGVVFAGSNYMLKFAGKGVYGEWFKDVSEYVCSEVFKSVGLKVQDTILGIYEGRKVVACKDIFNGKKFKPFSEVGDSSVEEKDKYSYSFDEIYKLIDSSSKIIDKDSIKNNFWKTYIIDALLANPDRHGKNWGFIYENNVYKICPIFDNGASLFPKITSEQEYLNILNDEEEINERVFERPVSLVKTSKGLSTYYEVITSKEYKDCNEALLEIYPKIKLNVIRKIVNSVDMPENRKLLIIKIVTKRYECILKKTYEELIKNEKE